MEDAQCHVAKQNEISCHSCCSLPCWCLAWENGAKSSKAEWLIRWFSSSWMWRTPFLYDLNSCAYLCFVNVFRAINNLVSHECSNIYNHRNRPSSRTNLFFTGKVLYFLCAKIPSYNFCLNKSWRCLLCRRHIYLVNVIISHSLLWKGSGADPGGKMGRSAPKTYESYFFHHNFEQFGKFAIYGHFAVNCFVTAVLWIILNISLTVVNL